MTPTDPFHWHTCPTCRDPWEHLDATCCWAHVYECPDCFLVRLRQRAEDPP
jgi:hypothetical protein